MNYKPLLISNFRIGLDEAAEPWLIPREAFPLIKNAHVYRGVLEKIRGYDVYARMCYRVTEVLGPAPNDVRVTYPNPAGTLTYTPASNNIVVWSAINNIATIAETFVYQSDGAANVLNLVSNLAGTGTVNIATKAITVTFNTPPAQVPALGNIYNHVYVSYDVLATDIRTPGDDLDIMGIKQYYAANGGQDIIVFDTYRAGKVITIDSVYVGTAQGADNAITEIPHEVQVNPLVPTPAFDGIVTVFTGSLSSTVFPGSVVIKVWSVANALLGTIVDNGIGALTGSLLAGTASFIDYSTGNWTLTFTAAPLATSYMTVSYCDFGDYWTGDYTNFFSTCNYIQQSSLSYFLFATNGVDPVRYYDGTCFNILPIQFVSAPHSFVNDITTCLHVAINRDRLLLLHPTVSGSIRNNDIYWSVVFDPLDFSNNEHLPAPTSEPIRAFSFINTDMIVRFANSERVFRYTSDAFSPFRWDSTNNVWRTDTRYSTINYDKYFTAIGKPAIVASDGVNMQRADEIIPDFTLNDRALYEGPVISIDQTSIGQCYGERFDDFKEGWLCFKQWTTDQGEDIQRSDAVLAFNYVDDTYAVYTFPFNCLGFGTVTSVDTWGNNYDRWIAAEYAWGSFYEDFNALVDLGGDRQGIVYTIGKSSFRVDQEGNPTPVLIDVLSKNFNPFVDEGELCRLGYVDLFVSSYAETKLRVQVYRDDTMSLGPDGNPTGAYYETTLTLTPFDSMSPTTAQNKIWKRVYVNGVAREHTLRFYQSEDDFETPEQDQPVRIHAIVLYVKPAGRIFN